MPKNDRKELARLIADARERVDAMTPEERAAMLKAQGESWARAETNWPKPRYKMVDGVKTYQTYEDYLND